MHKYRNTFRTLERACILSGSRSREAALFARLFVIVAIVIEAVANPPLHSGDDRPFVSKDALFFSPHKLVGGPGSPGVLVVKKRLLGNLVPAQPGGGTVFFVTAEGHRYLSNR